MTSAHLTLDPDALARMPLRLGRESRSLRPVRLRLDADGESLALDLPGADYLARLLDLPGLDVYGRASAILARPHGSEEPPEPLDAGALADGLRETLAALPDRPDAGEVYRDLRTAAGTSSGMFGDYLRTVVRAYARTLPAVPKRPKDPRTAGPSRTPAEREKARRAAWRAEEEETARYVLSRWREAGRLTPGRHPATDLYAAARAALLRTRAADPDRTLPDGSPLSDDLGPRNFYRIADEFFGPRTRTRTGYVYTIEEDHMAPMFTRDELLDRMAAQEREALAGLAPAVAEYLVQGHDTARNVVSLDAYRALRSA
jgi:hypothetical protein